MTSKTVTLTCPSCGLSREVPAANIPPHAVNVTCPACRHVFPLAEHLATPPGSEPDHFQFEEIPPSPASPTRPAGPSRPGQNHARSSFVTVVAWIFIILCGFATFISILQNVMINTLFPVEQMQQATADPQFSKMPAFFRFMMGNVRLFFASFLVVSATMFGAAVGLLKRKNWARLVFITLLSLGIVWNIAGMALQFFFMQDFPQLPGAPHEADAAFATMRTVMMVVSAVVAVAFSVLFGWIIKRFTSAETRTEFS